MLSTWLMIAMEHRFAIMKPKIAWMIFQRMQNFYLILLQG